MRIRSFIAAALLVLFAGNAMAGRACPSDAASGSGTCCDGKAPHAAHSARLMPAPAVLAPAAHTTAAAKPVSHQPQRSAVAPAFGPLFLAHQALML